MKLINILSYTPLDSGQIAEGLTIQDAEQVAWVNPKHIIKMGTVSPRGLNKETRGMTIIRLSTCVTLYTRELLTSVVGRVFNDVNLSDWDGVDKEWDERTKDK